MSRLLTYCVVVIMAATTFAACTNPEVVEISPDTYLLARTDKAGMFGNASSMKIDVIREANEFAASKGKDLVLIESRETPMRVGQYASIEYQFRLVDKSKSTSQSESTRSSQISTLPTKDVVIEKHDVSDRDSNAAGYGGIEKDVYDELVMLDDLRDRGVLTDAEFDAEKKKLLEGRR